MSLPLQVPTLKRLAVTMLFDSLGAANLLLWEKRGNPGYAILAVFFATIGIAMATMLIREFTQK